MGTYYLILVLHLVIEIISLVLVFISYVYAMSHPDRVSHRISVEKSTCCDTSDSVSGLFSIVQPRHEWFHIFGMMFTNNI